MGEEAELKLSYSPEALDRIRRSSLLRRISAGPARTHRLVTTYFDAEGGRLGTNGIVVRVRREGARRILCVKAPQASLAGLAVRREWEVEITGDVPDLSAFPPGTVDSVLDLGWLAGRLAPVFETAFTRTERPVSLPGGGRARLAVDLGEIRAGKARAPIAEVEIELDEGEPAALFDLGLSLHGIEPARIGTRAKSERGAMLAAGTEPEPAHAADLRLDAAANAGDAFRRIAGSCLGHWLANVDCVLADRDPEGIHQMRVALRRLRSAFRLFRPLIAGGPGEPLGEEVRWLAGELGPARDWDVFVENVLGPVAAALPGDPALAALAEAAAEVRAAAHGRATAAVGAPRHAGLVLGLGRWLADPAWSAADAGRPISDLSAERLDRAWRRVRKAGRHLMRRTPEELHALRIEIKRLRYAMEFFASLHDERAARHFLAGLKGMQDFLGHLNDLDVARGLMASLGGNPVALARAEGLVTGWHASGLARERRNLTNAWAQVLAQEPFWR